MPQSHWHGLAIVVLLACVQLSTANEAHWPQFRGPESLGTSDAAGLPDTWSEKENVRWRTPIAGRGWSSPIVWSDRIFLTTVINTGETEEAKRGLYFGGERMKPPESVHQWKVVCLDLPSGRIVWEQLAHEGVPEMTHHIKNSLASETPVTDGQRLYAYFGNLGIFAYDFAGQLLWSKPMPVYKTRYGWGTAASPVLHGDRLYIVNDNEEDSFLCALDTTTGEEIWRTERPDEKSNWATPYIWENEQRTEIVTPGTQATRSYDLDGKLLWQFRGMSSITIPTPFSQFGLLYVASGYVIDPLRPIYAIRPAGNIYAGRRCHPTSTSPGATARPVPITPRPYSMTIEFMYCSIADFCLLQRPHGRELWQAAFRPGAVLPCRLGLHGKVFCLDEYGVTFVVAAEDSSVLHENRLGEDEMCMATPALVDDLLLIRTDTQLYCIQQGAKLAVRPRVLEALPARAAGADVPAG